MIHAADRRTSVRRPLREHLPRDEKIHAPGTEACPACGGGLRHLGEDVAEQLEYVPASFRVIRHVRPPLPSGVTLSLRNSMPDSRRR